MMGDFDRVENLLVMLLLEQMSGASQQKKVLTLRRAGFKNQEIAPLLGTSTGVVKQQLYDARKGKGGKAKGRKKAG